jgi:hypothetical protein
MTTLAAARSFTLRGLWRAAAAFAPAGRFLTSVSYPPETKTASPLPLLGWRPGLSIPTVTRPWLVAAGGAYLPSPLPSGG